jgi:aconitate hydratase
MRGTITEKILSEHLMEGDIGTSSEIGIRIDQTLTQDATGTLAYLQFMELGLDEVRTELSVSYVDHNTLQTGFENADDHLFLKSVAARYGIYFSRPGNGICHQVHLERFGLPGKTLLGSDSHTPTAGGLGMLGIGAGGLDVAVAMAGAPFFLRVPQILNIRLEGELKPLINAKDLILHILGKLSVSGGVGKVIEYSGNGVIGLSVPQRATVTNMGSELGATASIFPSDERTKEFLEGAGRTGLWRPISADENASYGNSIGIDMGCVTPLVACPHSPDRVKPVDELAGMQVDQVVIGSCTNSSLRDLITVAGILKGKKIHRDVDLVISPGSRLVLGELARCGALLDMISSGGRILECACGPCIGMGQVPPSGGVSLRTMNRNFKGRCGTENADVYLCSPETAAMTALKGVIADPRELDEPPEYCPANRLTMDDSLIIPPLNRSDSTGSKAKVRLGPNIKPIPLIGQLPDRLGCRVLIKTQDNVSTDDILPAGPKVLPLRSNIPALSEYVFSGLSPGFARKAKRYGGGLIVGGENYGQGSSREHAALAPRYLGVKGVLAISFARIHRSNLINFGIIPLRISREDYECVQEGDCLVMERIRHHISEETRIRARSEDGKDILSAELDLSNREREILLAGGLLSHTKSQLKD